MGNKQTPDFEKLYYNAMRQVQLLTDKKIEVELTIEQIQIFKDLLFEELFEINSMIISIEPEDEELDEKISSKKLDLINELLLLKKEQIEVLIRKMNLEE